MCDVLDRVENKGRTEGIEQGRAEGIAQGRTEGIAQGRAEGITQGRTEGRIFVYYNDMELSAEQIAQKLNMPLEDVLKIIEEFKG